MKVFISTSDGNIVPCSSKNGIVRTKDGKGRQLLKKLGWAEVLKNEFPANQFDRVSNFESISHRGCADILTSYLNREMEI